MTSSRSEEAEPRCPKCGRVVSRDEMTHQLQGCESPAPDPVLPGEAIVMRRGGSIVVASAAPAIGCRYCGAGEAPAVLERHEQTCRMNPDRVSDAKGSVALLEPPS